MKRINLLLWVAASLISLTAHAKEYAFYERPSFMAESMPKKINCILKSEYYGTCLGDYTSTADVPVKISTGEGTPVQVKYVNPLVSVSCQQGVCVNDFNDTPVGDLHMEHLPASYTINWTIIDGYYIYHDTQKGVFAYKRGFGPLADKYPPYQIITEPVQRMSTLVDTTGTYDVVCLPQSDDCRFGDRRIPRSDLSKYIPKKSSEWCDQVFCYSNEFAEGVVGLNPEGMY
jgi:hypothetical protein